MHVFHVLSLNEKYIFIVFISFTCTHLHSKKAIAAFTLLFKSLMLTNAFLIISKNSPM